MVVRRLEDSIQIEELEAREEDRGPTTPAAASRKGLGKRVWGLSLAQAKWWSAAPG